MTNYQIISGSTTKLQQFADALTRTNTPFERVKIHTGKRRRPAIKVSLWAYAALLGHGKGGKKAHEHRQAECEVDAAADPEDDWKEILQDEEKVSYEYISLFTVSRVETTF